MAEESGPVLPGGRRPTESWESLIDRQIRRAMEAGEFDNLPGHGEPIEIDHDPLEDPSWWMARRMLKSAGFSHPAIESKRELEREIAAGPNGDPALWRAEINRRIRDHNLSWPQASMHLKPVSE